MPSSQDNDQSVLRAVAGSNLGALSRAARETLLADAVARSIEPGAVVQYDGETRPHVHLVVTGLVRLSIRADDGRTMTVRYCPSGELIGVASVFAPDFRLPAMIEAVTPAVLVDLSPSVLRDLVASDPAVGTAMLAETGERVQAYVEEIGRASFATVTERVARHLLDLSHVDDGGALVVDVTQEELAAAVGTVREVAARALRGLRDAGLIRTERNRVVILDPDRVAAASDGRA